MKYDITKSQFISNYKKSIKKRLMEIYPTWDEDKLSSIINTMVEERISIPKLTLHNSYTGEKKEASLLSVFDWALEEKPIITGNACFYKTHDKELNPVGQMLLEMLDERKSIKKEMFKLEDQTTHEYADMDRDQNNVKVNMNSYYGGSGAKSSAYYNEYSGPSTTLTCQQIISTTEQTFESFIADNYQFIDLQEFMDWWKIVKKEIPEQMASFISFVPINTVYERIVSKMLSISIGEKSILHDFICSLTQNERNFLYYKNNLITFIDDHPYVQNLIERTMVHIEKLKYVETEEELRAEKLINSHLDTSSIDSVKKWNDFVNTESFLDPNKIPSSIEKYVKELNSLLVTYVYVRYLPFDRIYRLRNFKRKAVTIIDTDSNIISIDTYVNYILRNISKGRDFGMSYLNQIFVIVNTITYSITDVVSNILDKYAESSNIPIAYRKRLNMKNEFFFIKLIVGKAKKRYISRVLLREGNLYKKPKNDVKGFDFLKATTSKETEEFFRGLIETYLMKDKIDPAALYNAIKEYTNEVYNSLRKGEVKYLPLCSAKELDAYKDPASEQSVRGTMVWDMIYPDNPIELPSKPKVLKLKLLSLQQLEVLKDKYPDVYTTLKDQVFEDTTGFFVKKKEDKTQIKGCGVICIPQQFSIPEWCLDIIDYTTVINNIIAPFLPVLEILGYSTFEVGKVINGNNVKSKKLSNIIKF